MIGDNERYLEEVRCLLLQHTWSVYIYIYCLSLARRAFLHMRACKFVHHALLRMCAR